MSEHETTPGAPTPAQQTSDAVANTGSAEILANSVNLAGRHNHAVAANIAKHGTVSSSSAQQVRIQQHNGYSNEDTLTQTRAGKEVHE